MCYKQEDETLGGLLGLLGNRDTEIAALKAMLQECSAELDHATAEATRLYDKLESVVGVLFPKL